MMIYTIGYGNSRQVSSMISVLKQRKIVTLVDCRTRPFSKWNPAFSQHSLKRALKENDLTYVHDLALGGYQDFGNGYLKRLDALEKESKNAMVSPIVLMCSELDPRSCHRYQKIGTDMAKRGIRLIHIDKDDSDWMHALPEKTLFD